MKKLLLNAATGIMFICWWQIALSGYFVVTKQDDDSTFLLILVFFSFLLLYVKFLKRGGNDKL